MEQRRIARYLPENYQLAAADHRGALWALLAAMDSMHAPVERVLKSLDGYVDPHRAPEPFVMMQASWLGLDRYFEWSGGSVGAGEARFAAGNDRLRLLVAEFPALIKSRGTRSALIRFLEVATGIAGFVVEDGRALETSRSFHLIVHVPAEATSLLPLVERIVAGERPAHATYELRMIDAAALTEPAKRKTSRTKKPTPEKE